MDKKREIIAQVVTDLGLKKKVAKRLVEKFIDTMASSLASDPNLVIAIPHFGKFGLRHVKGRNYRNPRTGAAVWVGERTVVHYKWSKDFKDLFRAKFPPTFSANFMASAPSVQDVIDQVNAETHHDIAVSPNDLPAITEAELVDLAKLIGANEDELRGIMDGAVVEEAPKARPRGLGVSRTDHDLPALAGNAVYGPQNSAGGSTLSGNPLADKVLSERATKAPFDEDTYLASYEEDYDEDHDDNDFDDDFDELVDENDDEAANVADERSMHLDPSELTKYADNKAIREEIARVIALTNILHQKQLQRSAENRYIEEAMEVLQLKLALWRHAQMQLAMKKKKW